MNPHNDIGDMTTLASPLTEVRTAALALTLYVGSSAMLVWGCVALVHWLKPPHLC